MVFILSILTAIIVKNEMNNNNNIKTPPGRKILLTYALDHK